MHVKGTHQIAAISVPGEPRKMRVKALNSTAVKIEWRPPANKERNGIIRGYLIHYVKVNEDNIPIGISGMEDVRGSEVNEMAIGGLQPDTYYQFTVAAYTRKRDGERSRPKTIKTKGAGNFAVFISLFSSAFSKQ